MPRGFFYDNTRCTGCRTCEMACKDYKDLSATIAFRKVYDYEGGAWSDVGDGTFTSDAFAYHVSISCNHCNNPVCTRVCPTGAMHKDELGLVWPDATKCIGCGYCTMFCVMDCILLQPDGFYTVDLDRCIGCRSCKVNCPFEAVIILPPKEDA